MKNLHPHPLLPGAVGLMTLAASVASLSANGRPASPVVDTGQSTCYDTLEPIRPPREGRDFFGQDAQYLGVTAQYTDNGDGTVTDERTGLMWSQSTPQKKLTLSEAQAEVAKCQFALRRERDIEKYKQTFEECETSAQHVRRLVESLLELARVDSGEFQIRYEETDLINVIEECTLMLSALAEQKSIALEKELEHALCEIDRAHIHQVVSNLMSNAIKYTPEGGHIKVTTSEDDAGCKIVIEDNGIGIEAEHLPHLFDRFYRASKERDERKSTGLGLATSKAIVDAHGGQIKVESMLGKGSRFEIWLPRKAVQEMHT